MTDGQLRYQGRMDVTITANQNDWAPVDDTLTPLGIGTSTSIYIDSDGDYSITGINAEAFSGGGNAGERGLFIHNNTTTRTFTFPGLDAGSSAANQFGWSGTISLGRGEGMAIKYDADAQLWKLNPGRVSAGGSTLPVTDTTAIAKGSTDATKQVRFECDTLVPTATTVALAVPAANGTIATLAGTETFTNKTIQGADLEGCSISSDGSFQGFKDQNGNEVLQVAGVASALNHCAFVNAATGNGPIFRPGTGGETDVVLNVTGLGTRGVLIGRNPAAGITTIEECGGGTANPASTTEGSRVFRTDLEEPFYYDSSRSKWLAYGKDTYLFGHSQAAPGVAAGTGIRIVGAVTSDGTNANYLMPYACTLVGYTWTRNDTDTGDVLEIVKNTTTAITINTGTAASGKSLAEDVDFAADDRLWVRVGSGSSTAIEVRSFVIFVRRKAT